MFTYIVFPSRSLRYVRCTLSLSFILLLLHPDGASKEISELDFLETSELTGQALAPYTDGQSGDLTMYTPPPLQ